MHPFNKKEKEQKAISTPIKITQIHGKTQIYETIPHQSYPTIEIQPEAYS